MTTLREFGLLLIAASGVTVVAYYAVINLFYFTIHTLALLELRDAVRESSWNPPFRSFHSPFYPGVAVLVPAYNEEATIVESLNALLALNYPDAEIVVVNDGSTDATLATLKENFDLAPVEADIPYEIPSEPIRGVYRSETHDDILVVDKENGGKSDALNAGLWVTDKELFCAVDSDTIIERDALLDIVRPFLRDPERTVASGGTVRVANDCTLENGVITEVALPKTGLASLQVMEYLRAFYSGRLGLARLNGLILISGAFGVFRADYVREIGGYRHDTITEDFDVVVRLHRYLMDAGEEYRVDFVPEPVAWTEVPETRRVLGRQRRRWYRGMIETVVSNRGMLFNPRYGRVGTGILPMFTAAEAVGPLVEGFGYLLLPIAWYLGILDFEFFVVFFLLTTGFGIFLSWFGIFSEAWSFNRYEDPRQVVRLLWYGVLENFGYRQWKTYVAWRGLIEYIRGEGSWGAMERTGFGTGDGDGDVPAPADTGTAGAGTDPPSSGRSESGGSGVERATPDGSDTAGPDDSGFLWWGDQEDGFLWWEDRDADISESGDQDQQSVEARESDNETD
jgi:cellulose synthase/poly-beta-1,6-N-acetylglucosamine synthase-like glycosyltransferase